MGVLRYQCTIFIVFNIPIHYFFFNLPNDNVGGSENQSIIKKVLISFVISLYIGPHKATLYSNVTHDNYLFLSIIYIYSEIIPFVYQKIYCL